MSRTNKKQVSTPTEPPDSFQNLIDHFPSLPEEKQKQIYEEIRSYLAGNRAHLLECYLQAVEEVKRRKNLPTQEKLERLLVPLIGYNKLDPFDEPIPFVDESVDIERELDLENLRYDEERYQLYDEKGDQIDASEVHGLVTSSSYIFVREKFDRDLENCRKMEAEGRDGFSSVFHLGKISLRDLHKEWLPSLDQEKITSIDLLDQVLVALTIKQAQNVDKEAIEKLYSLYKGAAEALAVEFADKFGFGHEKKGLKSDARWFLRFLITGFSLEDIINQLVGSAPKTVIKAIPPWVKNFYIYYLAEYLPQRMEKNIRETQRNQDLITELAKLPDDGGRNQAKEIGFLKARNFSLDFQWIGMLNPFAPFQADTLWRTLKRPNRFNSYSFRPGLVKMGPRRNLTTWLFGRDNEIDTLTPSKREDGTSGKAWQPYGKILQLLKDKYRPLIAERYKKKSFDFNDDFDEDHKESLSFKDRAKALKGGDNPEEKEGKDVDAKKVFAKLKKKLGDHGIPDRNIEIYFRWRGDGITQSEIAREYGLSTRQVRNICREIKEVASKFRKLSREFLLDQ